MRSARRRKTRICFILGKPIRPATIFPELIDLLRTAHATVRLHVARAGDPLPAGIDASDLVVQRGLHPNALARARHVELAGTRFCNPVAATIDFADRALTAQRLADHGLPVPRTVRVATWPALVALAQGQPVVVKAADGTVGRGRGVFISPTGSLPSVPPFAGPFIIQDLVDGGGPTYKLYVAGEQSRGLVKRWPPGQAADVTGVPFAIDTELAALGRPVGAALHLELFGVDVLAGPGGPVIVDVNPFPGFRGVPQAARLIADHLVTLARVDRDVHSR